MSLSKVKKNELTQKLLIKICRNQLRSAEVRDLANEFGVSTQAVYNLINKLVEEKVVEKTRTGKTQKLKLKFETKIFDYKIGEISEYNALLQVRHFSTFLPENAREIFDYIYSEIFNNAIEHSQGTKIRVLMQISPVDITTYIIDNGIGIFENIKQKLKLESIEHSVFELMKGKVTTNSKTHSGEGIFFSSKCADYFLILANNLTFSTANLSNPNDDKAIIRKDKQFEGTAVVFKISIANKIVLNEVFNQFSDPDEGFYKTIVPIKKLEYNEENPTYISRSQARRLMTGMNKFKEICLDFKLIPKIGQAFADEIFRVWKADNPNVKIIVINENKEIHQMIERIENNVI